MAGEETQPVLALARREVSSSSPRYEKTLFCVAARGDADAVCLGNKRNAAGGDWPTMTNAAEARSAR